MHRRGRPPVGRTRAVLADLNGRAMEILASLLGSRSDSMNLALAGLRGRVSRRLMEATRRLDMADTLSKHLTGAYTSRTCWRSCSALWRPGVTQAGDVEGAPLDHVEVVDPDEDADSAALPAGSAANSV